MTYEHWRHPDWKAAHQAKTDAFLALIDSAREIDRLRVEHSTFGFDHPAIVAYQYGPQQALRDNLGAAYDHLRATEARLQAEQPGAQGAFDFAAL